MRLQGRVAIVTGGGRGIGRGIAERLTAEGATVVIAQLPAEDAAAPHPAAGSAALTAGVDIRDRGQVKRLVAETTARFGRIHILVNNAAVTGLPAVSPFLECPDDTLNAILDVNVKGTIICSQEVAREMARHREGAIIHISSVAAFAGQERAAVYCASKAALEGLTRAMALELSRYGIRVNAVAPGDVLTSSNASAHAEMRALGVSGRYFRRIPQGRRGTPADVAAAVAFLASEDASYIQGTTLIVDGGFLAY
jgi:NAD(P)-dependent dehydrogenase (short-subunit alcohol dehydrogenase family)